jgi:hypothetical protein
MVGLMHLQRLTEILIDASLGETRLCGYAPLGCSQLIVVIRNRLLGFLEFLVCFSASREKFRECQMLLVGYLK